MMAFMKSCESSTSGVKGYLGALINFIKGVFTGNWKAAWQAVVQAFTTKFNNIKSVASGALNFISSLVSSITSKIQALINKIRGAKSEGSGLPSGIPGRAVGDINWRGGWVNVHEKGGEILNLPRGTQIIPHDVSMHMAESAGKSMGARSINIQNLAGTLIVREEADIDKIATALADKLEMIAGDVVYA